MSIPIYLCVYVSTSTYIYIYIYILMYVYVQAERVIFWVRWGVTADLIWWYNGRSNTIIMRYQVYPLKTLVAVTCLLQCTYLWRSDIASLQIKLPNLTCRENVIPDEQVIDSHTSMMFPFSRGSQYKRHVYVSVHPSAWLHYVCESFLPNLATVEIHRSSFGWMQGKWQVYPVSKRPGCELNFMAMS